ncbi:MAG: helix-turn-helix domain-containing protein [Bacteroidaceae bacterium]|nr:helix-turn-helix domain-containing protein [Bacteroidaceae bacterium]
MSNEVITHKHEWVHGLFTELDRIAKDAAMVADENQPLLGGEHYLTDRELAQRLKISRRTLQDYRNNGILPYRQLGGKILYRESDIERVLQSCYRERF